MTEMKKYSKIHRLGKTETVGVLNEGDYVVIYEKLDGANASFKRNNDTVLAFSRNNQLDITNTLRGFYNYTRKIDANDLRENTIYFGEWLVPHKVDYGANFSEFYLFDIYNELTGEYLPHTEVVSEAMRLGLTIAPILYAGKYRGYEHLQSLIGRSVHATNASDGEGIVVKNVSYRDKGGNQVFVKLVSEGFREVQKQKSPKNPDANIVEREFVSQTVTEARVDKQLRKLVDEGLVPEDFGLSDMGTILKAFGSTIVTDILEEEGELLPEIYDLQAISKAVGKRVPPILREIVEREETKRGGYLK